MTKKEREIIYRKAAEISFYGGDCGCRAIKKATKDSRMYVVREYFPEFFLFETNIIYDKSWYWWYGTNGNNARILALLFAAEMCKD